jgi:hypothetical protein
MSRPLNWKILLSDSSSFPPSPLPADPLCEASNDLRVREVARQECGN